MLSKRGGLLLLLVVAVLSAGVGAGVAHLLKPRSYAGAGPNDWLLGAASDEQRFRRIQAQLRGFDLPMWEVGDRYERMHEALERQNYELAIYEWQKIRLAIANGISKRPARAANAENMFLGEPYEQVLSGLQARTPNDAWQAFEAAKVTCRGCHEAEKVAWVNNQPLFDLGPPTRR